MERVLIKNNVKTGQLPKHPKYLIIKYLGERAGNITHEYTIINIIKKR